VTEPEVSVVVPAHDAAATLGAQLDALLAQVCARTYEIVVVDNRSTDATARLTSERTDADARVRLVPAMGGSGPSYARNVGFAACRAESVVCCDADDVVGPGWLDALARALDEHEYVGGPLEVDMLNATWVADGRGRWGAQGPGRFADVDFAHGCNLGIRKSLYVAVGGLDEALHAGEEVDLALRLARRGVALRFVPDAVVHYRFRVGIVATWRQARAHGRVARTLERRARSLLGRTDPFPEHATIRRALWLLTHAYRLATRAGRVRWTWIAGYEVGRLSPAIEAPPEMP
jgi:glycosyltransferase involved in cell wall biosynthesis